MKIIKNEDYEGFDIDVKRFYIPFTLQANCPKCERLLESDLSHHRYLSYPLIGEPIEETLYCGECDEEVFVELVLDLSLKLAEDK